VSRVASLIPDSGLPTPDSGPAEAASRVAALLGNEDESPEPPPTITFKHIDIVESPAAESETVADDVPMASPVADEEPAAAEQSVEPPSIAPPVYERPAAVPPPLPFQPDAAEPLSVRPALTHAALVELWEQEQRAARRKLEPEGALTGATRELQAGLGAFLAVCHEHGVKVGPWRLQHVVSEWSYGEHPTYGVVTIAHWACKDGQPWRVGIGLFLARGAGKPKDLEVKLAVTDTEPAVVDVLILHRPEDDLAMTGKSKTLLADAERRGKHARLEAVSLDGFAQLYAFPRWLAAVREGLPEGAPLPNLADIIQEKCEKLLEQVCMPVQG
jgi:hypothetical protein